MGKDIKQQAALHHADIYLGACSRKCSPIKWAQPSGMGSRNQEPNLKSQGRSTFAKGEHSQRCQRLQSTEAGEGGTAPVESQRQWVRLRENSQRKEHKHLCGEAGAAGEKAGANRNEETRRSLLGLFFFKLKIEGTSDKVSRRGINQGVGSEHKSSIMH